MLLRLHSWLRAAFRRDAMDREMSLEMREHLDKSAARLMSRGLSPEEARFAARREFGNVGYLEGQGRDARGASWVETLRADLRYALRALRASPAFATVAILSLAIGIGANTAIFSLINAVMLKALPVERPQELVQLRLRDSTNVKPDGGNSYLSNPIWEMLRDRTAPYASYAVSEHVSFDLAPGGETKPASGMWVNGAYFTTLGIRPELGQFFAAADDQRGCAATAVVSHAFWQKELGGRPDAIGKPIMLSGHPHTVLGVAPADFFGVDVGRNVQIFVPICTEAIHRGAQSALDGRTYWWLRILARPKPGVSATQLAARLRTESRSILEATVSPRFNGKRRAEFVASVLTVSPAGNGISGVRRQYSKALLVLMGMVGAILLISCANVANLLLARGAARSREIAIRIAIGASRARLIRQFLTESALLAAAGAALGVVFANWAARLLVRMLGGDGGSEVVLDLGLDLRVMGFTAAVALATVVIFGLAPAWRATRVDPQLAMKSGGRGTDGQSRFRAGKALVVIQSALALILVVAAGLLVTTFRHLTTLDVGFRSQGVMIAGVNLRRADLPPAARKRVQEQMLTQIRAIPGVRAASMADITPVSGSGWNEQIVVRGAEGLPEMDRLVWFNQVHTDFFRTMNTRLIAGRDFGTDDTPTSTRVAIVNEALAGRFFKNRSPLGETYYTDNLGQRGDVVTIVGVVANTKYESLREEAQPIVYLSATQDSVGPNAVSYLLSVDGPPSEVMGRVTTISRALNSRISLTFGSLSDVISRSLLQERVLAILSGFFGSLALVLAMIGLYGVMAYTVARRRIEIGIRIALGAARGRVVRLVLGDVGLLIGLGILIGGVVTYVSTKVLGSFLFGVKPRDPGTMLVAGALLGLSALIAGAIPARRAAQLEPVEALRED